VMVAEQAPAKVSKADKGLEGHRGLFERAWWASGAEVRDGAPYVSRSALVDWLSRDDGGGKTPKTAEQYAKPAFKNGMVGRLVECGYLAACAHGWVVADPEHASALTVGLRKT